MAGQGFTAIEAGGFFWGAPSIALSAHSKDLEAPIKTLTAVVVGLAIALSTQVAGAYVIQVVTTVPVAAATGAPDTSQLDDVIEAAIRDVLSHAIAFTPTVVRIEDARIVGERLYLVLLIADAQGEAVIEGLAADRVPDNQPEASDADAERSGGIVRPGAIRL